jgi:hypothetical protein
MPFLLRGLVPMMNMILTELIAELICAVGDKAPDFAAEASRVS